MRQAEAPYSISLLSGLYGERKAAIGARLRDFSLIRSEDWFYELVYCLLTPQSSAIHADAVVKKLRSVAFQEIECDPEPFLRHPDMYIRFHRTKSKHLLRARNQFPDVAEVLSDGKAPDELRSWLVKNVLGFGLKEATHFLRNIGKNGNLAILDRHILRNLVRFNVIPSIPKTLSPHQYFRIEELFQEFAEAINIPLNELDLLFWSMETGEIRK